jgi:hypothetical protein
MRGCGASWLPGRLAWTCRLRRRRRCGICAAGARHRWRRCSRSSPGRWSSRTGPGAVRGAAHRRLRRLQLGEDSDTGRSRSWVGKVRSAKFTDRVAVRLVSGQAAADFAARSENLAHGFGAVLCRAAAPGPDAIWLPLRLLLRKLVELLSGRPLVDMTAVQVDQHGPGAALSHAVHRLAQRGATVGGAVLDRGMIKDTRQLRWAGPPAGAWSPGARPGRPACGGGVPGQPAALVPPPAGHGGAGSSPARRARISPTVRSRLVGSGSGRCSWIW